MVVVENPKIGKEELADEPVEAKDINKDPVKVTKEEATHVEDKRKIVTSSADDFEFDEAILAEAENM